MTKKSVSIVSYLNSKPFLYGIEHSSILKQLDLSLDIPSKIVAKLVNNLVDIGLVPVAGLREMNDYQVISDYCIGAVGRVKTVLLVSDVPLENVKSILMDYQSRTSVLLAKVLAKFYWKRQFNWENTCADFHKKSINGTTAGIVIGDRVFDVENRFKYCYDLSEEWLKYTGLPFVFAVWAANKKISSGFETAFNNALAHGVDNISEVVKQQQLQYDGVDVAGYFTENISFHFDAAKRKGMQHFLDLAEKLEPVAHS